MTSVKRDDSNALNIIVSRLRLSAADTQAPENGGTFPIPKHPILYNGDKTMGACNFKIHEWGNTPQEAFDQAVEKARHLYGYIGTIAEKTSFKIVELLPNKSPEETADALMGNMDTWGDAGCIEVPEQYTLKMTMKKDKCTLKVKISTSSSDLRHHKDTTKHAIVANN